MCVIAIIEKEQPSVPIFFELDEECKNVPELLGLENYTVFPKSHSFRNEKWISGLSLFKTDGWKASSFILTGNVKSVQTLKKVLKDKKQGDIYSQGYWLEGKKGL